MQVQTKERLNKHLEAQKGSSWRFTSKELDEETGLYYYGARYYEPTSSRWMSADPAGFALANPMESAGENGWKDKESYSVIEGLNWYSYVSNNPVRFVDPTGMVELIFGLGVGGAAVKGRVAYVDGEWDTDVAVGIGAGVTFKLDFANDSSQINKDIPRATIEVSGKASVEAGPLAGLTFEGEAVMAEDGTSMKGKISGTMPGQGGALSPSIQFDTQADPMLEGGVEVNTDIGVDVMIFAGIGTDQDEW